MFKSGGKPRALHTLREIRQVSVVPARCPCGATPVEKVPAKKLAIMV
jgi:hypothetical protein